MDHLIIDIYNRLTNVNDLCQLCSLRYIMEMHGYANLIIIN